MLDCQRFVNAYQSQLWLFEEQCEVAPGSVVSRTGVHSPGHSVVQVASHDYRLTSAGDAMFPAGFEHAGRHYGFEHDPDEVVRVRVEPLRTVAEGCEVLAATHLLFPLVGRVALDGDAFRWVTVFWDRPTPSATEWWKSHSCRCHGRQAGLLCLTNGR
jgi:hypothetical protein